MKKTLFVFIFILLLSFSCSKDNVKPSEDSILAKDAFSSVDQIKKAYMDKNRLTLQSHIESKLSESVIKNLIFETAELTFSPQLVKITESTVTVNLNWRGTWSTTKDNDLKNRGVANLVLDRETMQLIQIDGDNPFLTPIIR
jgi:malate synthase